MGALFAGAFSAVGCSNGGTGGDGGPAPGTDAAPDCYATCRTTTTAACECSLPCRGELIQATCTAQTCSCTVDGAATRTYPFTTCDPFVFADGCTGTPRPDAGGGGDAGAGTDAGTGADDAGSGADDASSGADAALPPASYVTDTRTIVSSGISRTYLLAAPSDVASRSGLPLVFALHGDGGTGAGIRTSLGLEAHGPAAGAVYVYPDAPGGSFEYWTHDGRTREAQFVTDVIAALSAEVSIDTTRVMVTGFSGGATMANALGCLLGPSVIRGLGLHSGTLYSVDDAGGNPEFTYTAEGGVSCVLPDALFVWGQSDTTSGVSFADGQSVRDNYLATASCDATTTDGPITPCVTYDGCSHGVAWCAIAGMGHAVWPSAGEAMWDFFQTLP